MMLALAVALIAPLTLVIVLLNDRRTQALLLLFSWGAFSGVIAATVNGELIRVFGVSLISLKIEFAPLIEEFIKAFPLLVAFLIGSRYVERREIIVGAVFAGIGFSVVENYSYMLDSAESLSTLGLVSFILLRSFSATIMHGIATGIVGFALFYIQRGVFQEFGFPRMMAFMGYSFAVLLHALFNLFVQFQVLGRTLAIFGVVILYTGAVVFFKMFYADLSLDDGDAGATAD